MSDDLKKLAMFAELLPEYIEYKGMQLRGTMNRGEQIKWKFPNGWGASLVNHMGSYGSEFAVLKDGRVSYDNAVANDVLGWVEVADVALYLARLRGL